MVEIWLIIGLGTVAFLAGVVGGALVCWLRLALLERKYYATISRAGVDARKDKAEKTQEAILSLVKKIKVDKMEPMKAVTETATEFPGVAWDLANKGLGKLLEVEAE